jgi:anaerobic magnesium-protoporphyrin IX monomethyl ester cyclase
MRPMTTTQQKFLFFYCSAPEMGVDVISQPLGVLYLGAILEELGIPVKCIDERIVEREVLEAAIREADIVGISTMTPFLKRALDWAKYVKEQGKTCIIGGPHATVDPDSLLDSGHVDYVFHGEAELSIREALPVLDQPDKLKEIMGLGFFDEKGEKVITAKRPFNKELNEVPFPARHLIPIEEYFKRNKERLMYVFTSRGCPFDCVFCQKETYGRGFRTRSVENVCDELEELVRDYQPGSIMFIDELFTTQKKRVIALCEEMVRRKIKLDWVCETRVDCIDYDMMMAMRKAGMRRIYFGVESGSPQSLKTLKKRFTLEKVIETLQTARKAHIWTKIFLILGTPGETAEDVEQTAQMLRLAQPDMVRSALFNPLIGSESFNLYKDRIDFDLIFKEYVASGGTPYIHENFSIEELNELDRKLISEYEEWYDKPMQRFNRWVARMKFYLGNPSWIPKRLAESK